MSKHKKKLFEILKNDTYGLCPAPMSSIDAIDILTEYLLGEDFYIAMPLNREQANTSIVYQILMQYSKKFRKDFKRFKKELKENNQLKESFYSLFDHNILCVDLRWEVLGKTKNLQIGNAVPPKMIEWLISGITIFNKQM